MELEELDSAKLKVFLESIAVTPADTAIAMAKELASFMEKACDRFRT